MTAHRNPRLAFFCLAALAVTACYDPPVPPLDADSGATFRIYDVLYSPRGEPERELRKGIILGEHAERLTDRHGETFLVALPAIVDESCLDAISASMSPLGDVPVLHFKFNAECSEVLGQHTARHINRRMAAVLNGELISTPLIRNVITSGAGYVEGDFDSLEKVEAIVDTFYSMPQ